MKSNILYLLIALVLVSCSGSNGPSVKQRRAEQLEKFRSQLQTERQTLKATDSLMMALIPQINTAKARALSMRRRNTTTLEDSVLKVWIQVRT